MVFFFVVFFQAAVPPAIMAIPYALFDINRQVFCVFVFGLALVRGALRATHFYVTLAA